jgi:very-short-patch-repair endonuclease
LRDKGTAQRAALKSGRAQHPTEGKKRPPDVRVRISESVAHDWQNLSKEKLQERSEVAKRQWQQMSQDERDALLKAANEAVREASKHGSRLERSLMKGLKNQGYVVDFHKQGLIPNVKLQIDMYLPTLGVAIEVDGPSHFLPIWGEENFQRNIASDAEKTGLLLTQGLVIIRVKHLQRSVSAKLERDTLSAVLDELHKIEKKKPTKHNRLIEIEV